MKKKKVIINKIIIAFILFMNLLLSIVKAENYNTSDFNVIFDGTPNVFDSNNVVAKILDSHTATIEVTGLRNVGDVGTAEFILQNVSNQLDAKLVMKTRNTNGEYFIVRSELEKTKLQNDEKVKLKVSVELIKEPIDDTVHTDITVEFLAEPIYDSKDTNENIKEPPTKVQEVVDEIKEFIPNTGDSIVVYVIMFIVLVIILIVITIIKKTLKED